MDRGTRRDRTARVAARRLKERQRVFAVPSPFRPDEFWQPRLERWQHTGFFAKHSSLGCRCSKRRHGQPKLHSGQCGGDRERIYDWRFQDRRLRRLAQRGPEDWLSDRVALLE